MGNAGDAGEERKGGGAATRAEARAGRWARARRPRARGKKARKRESMIDRGYVLDGMKTARSENGFEGARPRCVEAQHYEAEGPQRYDNAAPTMTRCNKVSKGVHIRRLALRRSFRIFRMRDDSWGPHALSTFLSRDDS